MPEPHREVLGLGKKSFAGSGFGGLEERAGGARKAGVPQEGPGNPAHEEGAGGGRKLRGQLQEDLPGGFGQRRRCQPRLTALCRTEENSRLPG